MTVAELNTFVRFYLGNLPTTTIDDTTLNFIIQMVLDSGVAENDCQEKYYSTLETLRWLDRKELQEKGSDGVTGALVSQREKEGGVEYENKYSTPSHTDSTSWQALIDNLTNDTSSIGCTPFTLDDVKSVVIIGGADVNGYERSYETRKSWSETSYNSKTSGNYPWRP